MKNHLRSRVIGLWMGGFLFPPGIWVFFNWYLELFSGSETLAVVMNPALLVYVTAYVGLAYFYIKKQMGSVDDYLNNPATGDKEKAQKAVANLPKVFLILLGIYCVVGPNTGMFGMDFIDSTEYMLGALLGIPAILLFSLPFWVAFLGDLEKYAIKVPMSEKHPAFQIRGKILVSSYLAFGGGVWLILVSAYSCFYKATSLEEGFSHLLTKGIVITIIGLIAAALDIVLFSRQIGEISTEGVNNLKQIASGNLRVNIEVSSRDEFGHILLELQKTVTSLSDMFNDIQENATVLLNSSENMQGISQTLTKESSTMSEISSTASASTEQISVNIASVASAVKEASGVMSDVSGASGDISEKINKMSEWIEDISSKILSIANNAKDAMHISDGAKKMSKTANETMDVLGQGAEEIGNVTSVIKRIAEQTNLLALNATIEAASAGDAGKGFAVVANEIKELANQSSSSAEDISKRVETIQGRTGDAVSVISEITSVIEKMSSSSADITSAVDSQTSAVSEISEAIKDVSENMAQNVKSIYQLTGTMDEMSKNSSEVVIGVNDVAENISIVSKSAEGSNNAAQEVNSSSEELSSVASKLQEHIRRFQL